ncbi:MAG: PhzF family phenazine biosynthesis protein [Chitinophagaceae bacterium]
MELKLYQVDAFTNHLFGGNPAAIVPLQEWLSTEMMQKLALENNLSETVFFVPSRIWGGLEEVADFDIRWFTPGVEINLCGHATLAAAFVLFNKLGFAKETLTFNSKSGLLKVVQRNGKLEMDFPSWKPSPKTAYPELLQHALGGAVIKEVYQYRDLLVLLEDEAAVKNCQPDFTLMKKVGEKIIITAKGENVDFVSRFFAPTAGIDEDPVTGSAHSQLIPFWHERLGKKQMTAKQLSHRGGDLFCTQVNEDRVIIGGECVFYMEGRFWM